MIVVSGGDGIDRSLGDFLQGHFAPFKGSLTFGNLESSVRLYGSLAVYNHDLPCHPCL